MQSRLVYIDLLRAFAITLVIAGHVMPFAGFGSKIEYCNGIIHSFHMPLFAILSGLFFSADISCREFFRKKSRQLLLPLVSWCFIVYVIVALITWIYEWMNGGDSVHLFATVRNFWYGLTDWGWWFIRALFFCFVYAYSAMRICQGRTVLAIIVSVLLLFSASFLGVIPNKMPLLIGFVFLYPFFCVGILLKRYNDRIENRKKHFALLSFLLFAVMLFFWHGYEDTYYSMNTSIFETDGYHGICGTIIIWKTLFRFLIGTAGSLASYFLFSTLFDNKHAGQSSVLQFFAGIGQCSLMIYILHGFVIDELNKRDFVLNQDTLSILFITVLLTVVLLFACYFVAKLTLQNKWLSLLLWGKS